MKTKQKILTLIIFNLIFINVLKSQRIESNTVEYHIKTGRVDTTQYPPQLRAQLEYIDDNGNGILESMENSILTIKLKNQKLNEYQAIGPAYKINIIIKSDKSDRNLVIEDNIRIPLLEPSQEFIAKIPIKAKFNIKTNEHTLKIIVTEARNYSMDTAKVRLKTIEYQKPKLVIAGIQIFDSGKGTSSKIPDGNLQAGEVVKMKLVLQNQGKNVAKNVNIKKLSVGNFDYDDKARIDFYINDEYKFDEIKIGEYVELWYQLSLNQKVTVQDTLPVYLSASVDYDYGSIKNKKLPIVLNKKIPKMNILNVAFNPEDLAGGVTDFEYSSEQWESVKHVNINMVEPVFTKRENNSFAVIIGVENYKFMIKAPYAERDAELMQEYFKKKLGIKHTDLFLSKDVVGDFFHNYFNPYEGILRMKKNILPEETDLFVYYSGHGYPSKDGTKIYLVPSDKQKSGLITEGGYDLNRFYNDLNKLNFKSVTIFFDACFSGSSKKSEQITAENITNEKGLKPIKDDAFPKPWLKNPSFSVFTSSTAKQTSLAYDVTGTGLFSFCIMKGLKGEANSDNNNIITLGELKNYVIKEVTELSKYIGNQTPTFNGNEDLILIKLKSDETDEKQNETKNTENE